MGTFRLKILTGTHELGVRQERGGENKFFSIFKGQYLENSKRQSKVTINV